jgi:hypothetical protein
LEFNIRGDVIVGVGGLETRASSDGLVFGTGACKFEYELAFCMIRPVLMVTCMQRSLICFIWKPLKVVLGWE